MVGVAVMGLDLQVAATTSDGDVWKQKEGRLSMFPGCPSRLIQVHQPMASEGEGFYVSSLGEGSLNIAAAEEVGETTNLYELTMQSETDLDAGGAILARSWSLVGVNHASRVYAPVIRTGHVRALPADETPALGASGLWDDVGVDSASARLLAELFDTSINGSTVTAN